MTPSEAAALLAHIAANDNREVTESAAKAWAAALPDVDVRDAIEVLPGYYREATRDGRNWVYPGDILNLVRELHRVQRREFLADAHRAFLDEFDPDERAVKYAELKRLCELYDSTHKIPAEPNTRETPNAEMARVLSGQRPATTEMARS